MRRLYLQTDSTGMFRHDLSQFDNRQPHLVRLAWGITEDGKPVKGNGGCLLIKPQPGWEYEEGAIAAHGVTRERAMEDGVPLKDAILRFLKALTGVDEIVAFNQDFHRKILRRAAQEADLDLDKMFDACRWVCAMRSATDIVRIPRMAPGGGWSFPKLGVAYQHFAGRPMRQPDDPVARGIYMVHAVYVIHRGILDAISTGVSR
jgi:hypothetical protein